jgi:cytochrome P450
MPLLIMCIIAGMDPLGFGFPQWFFRALVALPGLSHGYHKFIAFCTQSLDDRIKQQGKTENTDIISHLIDQYQQATNKSLALSYLQGDSRLIIVAGSDTTAATLVHLFRWLAKKPELQTRLREELQGKTEHQDLLNNDFLNGLINETLRMNPPVPSGVFRKTPPEGIDIGNTFVPGNTVIQIPHYSVGHGKHPPLSSLTLLLPTVLLVFLPF